MAHYFKNMAPLIHWSWPQYAITADPFCIRQALCRHSTTNIKSSPVPKNSHYLEGSSSQPPITLCGMCILTGMGTALWKHRECRECFTERVAGKLGFKLSQRERRGNVSFNKRSSKKKVVDATGEKSSRTQECGWRSRGELQRMN